MATKMALLGDFAFSVADREYQRITRTTSYGFAKIEPAQSHAVRQKVGAHEQELSISGSIITLQSGLDPLSALREQSETKEPQKLLLGYGKVLGDFVVTTISETDEIFLDDGKNVKTSFTLELERVY